MIVVYAHRFKNRLLLYRYMPSLLSLFILIFSYTASWAQHSAQGLSRTNFYAKHIPYLYETGNYDSLETCIREWDESSKEVEELTRLKILWAIKNDSFSESLYGSEIISQLLQYRKKILLEKNIETLTDIQREEKKYIFSDHIFNNFTKSIAEELSEDITSENDIRAMFVRFYTNEFDHFFHQIKAEENYHTRLYSYYKYYTTALRDAYEKYIEVSTGFWVPTRDISAYGTHPGLGLALGFKQDKNTFQIVSVFRFIEGEEKFYIDDWQQNKPSYFVRSFYFALESRRDLTINKKMEFYIGLGIGAENYSFFYDNPDYSIKHMQSVLANISLGYKYYFSAHSTHFNGQILLNRYGLYDGDYAMALRFAIGFSLSDGRSDKMRFLNY